MKNPTFYDIRCRSCKRSIDDVSGMEEKECVYDDDDGRTYWKYICFDCIEMKKIDRKRYKARKKAQKKAQTNRPARA